MKILGCRIAGFGRFSDESFEFREGVNTMLKENGLGKTTLQAFLRVMLYGFKDENKKSRSEREREIRRPWQGGAYGGTLDIEAGGRSYRIERTFGSKASEDRLRVFDLSTRLVTDELGETPGKAIFGVDSDTFERTVFVSDETIRTNISDGVHSKLGDLVEDTVDVNRYEQADAMLADALTKWSENRSTGELSRLKSRITALEQEILSKGAVERNLKETADILRQKQEEDTRLKEEEAKIQEKQEALSKYQLASGARMRHETLKEALSERKAELGRAAAVLPLGVPTATELEEARGNLLEYETKSGLAKDHRLSEKETEDLKRYEAEFSASTLFDGEGEEYLALSEQTQHSEQDLRTRRKEIEKDRERSGDGFRGRIAEGNAVFIAGIAAAVIGLVLLIVGIAMKWEAGVPLGIVLLAAGVIGGGLGFLRKRKAKREAANAAALLEEKLRDLEKEESYLADSLTKLKAFFARFGRSFDLNTASQEISRLTREQDLLTDLRKKAERFSGYEQASKEAGGRVQALLRKYLLAPGTDYREDLKALADRKDRYDRAEEEFVRAQKAVAEFEAKTDMDALQGAVKPDFPETLTELNETVRKIRTKLTDNQKEETAYSREEERLNARIEELTEAEAELGEAREKRVALREAVSLVSDTRIYLERAKRSLSEKYTNPVTGYFRAYVAEILGESGLKFDITPDGYAVIEERGVIREVDLFSSGYQVLTYFCMRLALVEAMYEGEKPVLFLDDPFAELDQNKLEKALTLLRKVGQRYQILYVTCHPSRV